MQNLADRLISILSVIVSETTMNQDVILDCFFLNKPGITLVRRDSAILSHELQGNDIMLIDESQNKVNLIDLSSYKVNDKVPFEQERMYEQLSDSTLKEIRESLKHGESEKYEV